MIYTLKAKLDMLVLSPILADMSTIFLPILAFNILTYSLVVCYGEKKFFKK